MENSSSDRGGGHDAKSQSESTEGCVWLTLWEMSVCSEISDINRGVEIIGVQFEIVS